jgi:hypothetical protein
MTVRNMMKYMSDEFDEVLARNGVNINSYWSGIIFLVLPPTDSRSIFLSWGVPKAGWIVFVYGRSPTQCDYALRWISKPDPPPRGWQCNMSVIPNDREESITLEVQWIYLQGISPKVEMTNTEYKRMKILK